jgi:large subunit ribosomal protein L25
VDFYQLNEGKEISMNIPVQVEGAAPGVLNSGGTLILNKRKLRVRALPGNLPDMIVANISGLKLGNKLYTKELQSDDYTLLHPDNTVVCQVKTSRASMKDLVEQVELDTDQEGGDDNTEETAAE